MRARSLTTNNAARIAGSSLACRNTPPAPGRSRTTNASSSPAADAALDANPPEPAARGQFHIEMHWMTSRTSRRTTQYRCLGPGMFAGPNPRPCLLYTSDAADEEDSVDLG